MNLTTTGKTLPIPNCELKALHEAHVTLSSYNALPPCVLGVPGNIITILVANRERNRNLSPSVYMTAMAVVDSILLLESAWFLPVYYGVYIKQARDWQYITAIFLIFTCGMLSGLFLTAMSLDRLIAVRYPMKASSLCTRSKALKVVLVISSVFGLANLNLLYNLYYIKDPVTGVENLLLGRPDDFVGSILTTTFQLIFGTILPFMIIIGCNLIIIFTVRKASKKRLALKGVAERSDPAKSETSFLTRMLIFVSIAYVITSIPYRMFLLVILVPEVAESFDLTDSCTFLIYNIFVTVFFAVWLWNYASNFYMYALGGGHRYRDDVKAVIRSLLPCCSEKA